MQYIKPFRWLGAVIIVIFVITEIFQRSSLQNSEWVSGGWIWLLLAPCLIVFWIVAQILALKDMKAVLIHKYTCSNSKTFAIPHGWYFIPIVLVIVLVVAAIYLNSRDGNVADGALGGIEMLVVMAPTAIVGSKLFYKGIKKAL